MKIFYAELAAGTPPVTALWRAKRALRERDPRFADPAIWAPFVVIGLPDEPSRP